MNVISCFLIISTTAVLSVVPAQDTRSVEKKDIVYAEPAGPLHTEYSGAGIDMVFGPLGSRASGVSVAVHVLPIVVFFAALMSVLYHLRIMQVIVRLIGGAIQFIVGTHKVESLNAAANVFIAQTEAPLTVRPYLKNLTDAQLFAIMVSGMASVAGTVMAAYAQMGIRVDYLLAASFMSAPGGLLMAKLMFPDEPGSATADDHELDADEGSVHHANVILAAANGAAQWKQARQY